MLIARLGVYKRLERIKIEISLFWFMGIKDEFSSNADIHAYKHVNKPARKVFIYSSYTIKAYSTGSKLKRGG